MALGCGAVVVGGAGCGLRIDHGGDRVVHRRIVESALEPAAVAVAVGDEVQLVDRDGRAVVGWGAVGVEGIDKRGAPSPAAPRGDKR